MKNIFYGIAALVLLISFEPISYHTKKELECYPQVTDFYAKPLYSFQGQVTNHCVEYAVTCITNNSSKTYSLRDEKYDDTLDAVLFWDPNYGWTEPRAITQTNIEFAQFIPLFNWATNLHTSSGGRYPHTQLRKEYEELVARQPVDASFTVQSSR